MPGEMHNLMSTKLIDIMEYGNIQAQPQNGGLPEAVQSKIISAVREIRFGAVEIVIHDGRVVQIERKEKVRFDRVS